MPVSRRQFLVGSSTVIAAGLVATNGGVARAESGRNVVLKSTLGVVDADLVPATGAVDTWGRTGSLAVDLRYRSLVLDLGAPTRVDAVELTPLAGAHGLTGRDFTVWVSLDNVTYRKVAAEFTDLGSSVWLSFRGDDPRYVKIHCNREYTDAKRTTFTVDAAAVRAHRLAERALIAGNGGSWAWVTTFDVENATDNTLLDRTVYLDREALGIAGLVSAGRAAADLSDLRFAAPNGDYLHAYADGGGVYVRVPELAAGDRLPVRMFSGNPKARTTVNDDVAALQVEYGARTITDHDTAFQGTNWGTDFKVTRLGSGVLMASGGVLGGGIAARYSYDEGRTWTEIQEVIPKTDGRDHLSTGSYYADPNSELFILFYYSMGPTSGKDWMNPADKSLWCMVARSHAYDDKGRPVFTEFQRLIPEARNLGLPSAWALTYTNPVRTPAGTLVVPIAHVIAHDSPTLAVTMYRSTDDGVSWVPNEHMLTIEGTGFEVGISETALIVREDGTLLAYLRKQMPGNHYLARTTSSDDGVSWSPIADSDILSSNTFPSMFRDRQGSVVLSWSGHNAQGQESYWRNNLTHAFSLDDGDTFHGYQDMLGGSSYTTSGVLGGDLHKVRVVQSDSTRAGDHDRLIGWTTWDFNGTPSGPHTMLVEDYEAFVHRSTGALDQARFRDPATAGWGSELGSSRWWRATGHGSFQVGPGARAGRSAVRMLASTPGQAQVVQGSRIFPAIRRGTVSLALKAKPGHLLDIALQEGFCTTVNAHGTASIVRFEGDGRVRVTRDHRFTSSHSYGWCDDPNPATGNLKEIGRYGVLFGFDVNKRSIGADFGSPTPITQVTLIDSDSTRALRPGSRLKGSDLTVWVSDTNAGDWRQLTDWTGSGVGSPLIVSGPAVTARYIKVNCAAPSDNNFTFVNWLEQMIRTDPATPSAQAFEDVGTVRLVDGQWLNLEWDVDLKADKITLRVGGESVTLPPVHPAEVLTHLMVMMTGPSTGNDVSVDEFMVRDLDRGTLSLAGRRGTVAL